MKLIIVRGPSGAGKSTFINTLPEEKVVCSADHFWYELINNDGPFTEEQKQHISLTDKRPIIHYNGSNYFYNFDVEKLAQSHTFCYDQFLTALEEKIELIVLDNTNIKLTYFENYVRVAKLLGYIIEIHEFMPTDLLQLKSMVERNVHGCPPTTSLMHWFSFELHSEAICHDIKI